MPESAIPSTDVAVLGAGPGGAVASLCLSARGVAHTVIDKAVFPRDKICGDAFSGKVADVLRGLGLNWPGEQIQLPSWGVTFVAPNGRSLRVPFRPGATAESEPGGFISRRIDFDNFLVERMLEGGLADFRPGLEARSFSFEDGAWKIMDKSGAVLLRARYLIAADGAQSAFARTVVRERQDPAHFAAGIRTYYGNVAGLDAENFIELHFLEEFVPGYLWIFPLPGNRANVGIGLRSDLVKRRNLDLKRELFRLIADHPALRERFADAEMLDGPRGWGLPFGSRKLPLSGQHYVLVGDAASLIDPFTGEGIGNAMISGRLAAETVATALQQDNSDLSAYDGAVYRQLWKELHLSHRLQQLATKKWLFNWLVNKAVTNEALSQMISGMFMDLDMRDQLKQPSFYLKLLSK